MASQQDSNCPSKGFEGTSYDGTWTGKWIRKLYDLSYHRRKETVFDVRLCGDQIDTIGREEDVLRASSRVSFRAGVSRQGLTDASKFKQICADCGSTGVQGHASPYPLHIAVVRNRFLL